MRIKSLITSLVFSLMFAVSALAADSTQVASPGAVRGSVVAAAAGTNRNIIQYTTPGTLAGPNCSVSGQAFTGEPFVINHFRISRNGGTSPTLWSATTLTLAGTMGFVRMDAVLPEGWYLLESWSVPEYDANAQDYCKSTEQVFVKTMTYAPKPKKILAPFKTNYMIR